MRNKYTQDKKPNKATLKALNDVLKNRNISTIKNGDVEKFFNEL